MHTSQYNCFTTDQKKSGNAAVVITEFEGTDSECQHLAHQIGQPVTVFISQDNGHTLFKFFYPDTHTTLCLHGTLAGAKVLFQQSDSEKLIINLIDGRELELIKVNDDHFQIKVRAQKIPTPAVDLMNIKQMLNIEDSHIISQDFPIQAASVGSPKLLIPIISEALVAQLQPNFALIKEWSLASKINGLYVYSRIMGGNFKARGFNPKSGRNEDAATGVAAAALALTLKESITVSQGDEIGNPCAISVNYLDDDNIFVGGNVTKDDSI